MRLFQYMYVATMQQNSSLVIWPAAVVSYVSEISNGKLNICSITCFPFLIFQTIS